MLKWWWSLSLGVEAMTPLSPPVKVCPTGGTQSPRDISPPPADPEVSY